MSSVLINRLRRTWGLRTLGMRLVLGYATVFVASTLFLAVLAYVLFVHFMREPDRVFMEAQARELAGVYEQSGIDGLRRTLIGAPAEGRREELIVRLAGRGGETRLLFNPDNWRAAEVAQLAAIEADEHERWVSLGQAEDEDALEAFVLRLPDGSVLQVGMDADLRADALTSIREAFFVIAIPVLILAMLVGMFMAYRALRPVRQLVATLHAVIETGDIEMRVPTAGARGEFAELILLFNRMVDRIEHLVAGMRGTLDNVAHDLRTPMTRLRGRAEMALRAERDTTAYRDALAENLEDSEAVLTMLDTMMEVAEAEAGVMPLQFERVWVRSLAEDVIALYELVAEERGVTLQHDVREHVVVWADRSRLRRVLANLVDNAIKYTPRGGEVQIRARREGDHVSLSVQDEGPGIPEAERYRIWDRLYRGDVSRSERGLGLGLSLVKAIVEAHGGRVHATNRSGGGAEFVVRLPVRSLDEAARRALEDDLSKL